jgi:hypothetical protein
MHPEYILGKEYYRESTWYYYGNYPGDAAADDAGPSTGPIKAAP